jgi:hypothetical protein
MTNFDSQIVTAGNLYQLSLTTPFPLRDVVFLSIHLHDNSDLHGALDIYWATIAGHASSLSSVLDWSEEKLIKCRQSVSKPFFVKYPNFQKIRRYATKTQTPNFLWEYKVHERMRRIVLQVVERLLTQDIK